MAVETLTSVYTTQAEIERIAYGEDGVPLIVDDITPGEESTFWVELTEDATDFINEVASLRYDPVDMADSRWVRSRSTWVGAYFLSQRRGNPALFVNRFDEITDELQRVAEGKIIIPRLPTRENFTPAMSNIVVNDYFNVHKLRVHPSISTGGGGKNQDIAPIYPWEWLSIAYLFITYSLTNGFL